MRIIAGKWKGRGIASPNAPGVRPTTDRMRETLFSIIENHFDLEGSIIADLCAGTGALGFEALSRGAARCYFVERQRKMCDAIALTAATFGASAESFSIRQTDALRFAADKSQYIEACDIVFFDPPYSELLCNKLAHILSKSKLLRPGGLLIAEHDAREAILPPLDWTRITRRETGATTVDFLRKKE